MNKKQLKELMPRSKDDEERAKHIASLGYAAAKPVVDDMLRWLRTYESPVANVFAEFFAQNGIPSAEEVDTILRTSRLSHLKYVIVTRVLPAWPRQAIERVAGTLSMLATHSGEPETALMSIELLTRHGLNKTEWHLKEWLEFITERLERNLNHARKIKTTYHY